jgi:hypothetical protein
VALSRVRSLQNLYLMTRFVDADHANSCLVPKQRQMSLIQTETHRFKRLSAAVMDAAATEESFVASLLR